MPGVNPDKIWVKFSLKKSPFTKLNFLKTTPSQNYISKNGSFKNFTVENWSFHEIQSQVRELAISLESHSRIDWFYGGRRWTSCACIACINTKGGNRPYLTQPQKFSFKSSKVQDSVAINSKTILSFPITFTLQIIMCL